MAVMTLYLNHEAVDRVMFFTAARLCKKGHGLQKMSPPGPIPAKINVCMM